MGDIFLSDDEFIAAVEEIIAKEEVEGSK